MAFAAARPRRTEVTSSNLPMDRDALYEGGMSDKAETAAIRLWRDRVHLREQERDEAQL